MCSSVRPELRYTARTGSAGTSGDSPVVGSLWLAQIVCKRSVGCGAAVATSGLSLRRTRDRRAPGRSVLCAADAGRVIPRVGRATTSAAVELARAAPVQRSARERLPDRPRRREAPRPRAGPGMGGPGAPLRRRPRPEAGLEAAAGRWGPVRPSLAGRGSELGAAARASGRGPRGVRARAAPRGGRASAGPAAAPEAAARAA